MIPAGRLRHFLTVQRPSEGTGGARPIYEAVGTVWAEKLGLAGRKVSGLEMEADYRLTFRVRDWLKPTDRFVEGTEVLKIVSSLDLTGDRMDQTVLVQRIVA